MSKNNNSLSNASAKALGNYTKGAVESFEENIVAQKDYLEKVDRNLKNKENNK